MEPPAENLSVDHPHGLWTLVTTGDLSGLAARWWFVNPATFGRASDQD
jgi:hypothetical protein